MVPPVLSFGGSGQPLLFAHANGYPPGSYRELFQAMAGHFAISAIEHRPLWGDPTPPARLHWALFADDLLSAITARFDKPVWVMGHSMGGTVAALAAARRPDCFAGLILLDPVFLPDRYVIGMRLMPASKQRQLPMIRRALARPEAFADSAEAFAFYREKRAFRGLSDVALWHYVEASKEPSVDGGVQLRYSGAWEAAVYSSAPRVRPVLRRLRLPTLGLRGSDSDTLSPEIWRCWTRWQPTASFGQIPGGHLFPLESPERTAQAAIGYVFSD